MSKIKKLALGALAATALVTGAVVTAVPAQAKIVLYNGVDYAGASYDIGGGMKTSLTAGDFDNKTSSFKVSGGNSARLFEKVDYKGYGSPVFWVNVPDLRDHHMPDGREWNNNASSVY